MAVGPSPEKAASVGHGFDAALNGRFLLSVVTPAFQETDIVTTVVGGSTEQGFEPGLNGMGVELAQEFGAAAIHPF